MHVNDYFIDYFVVPLIGSADDDSEYEKYRSIDVDDEEMVKTIIKERVKPVFEARTEKFKELAKRTLSYYLTTNKIDWGRIYDSLLIAFDHPKNPKDFFYWIWEVLFENESYIMDNWQEYKEIRNDKEPRIL